MFGLHHRPKATGDAAESRVNPPIFDRRTVLVAVLTLFVALFPFWPAFDYPGLNMDEGMLLLYPELAMKGQVPYRDFETFYGPANIYALAGAYSVCGVSISVERAVGLLYRALLFAGIFVFARRWGTIAATFATLLGALFLVISHLPAFAWLGGVACVLWSVLSLSGNPRPWRAGVAGLLAAVALLYRPDLGPAVIASALPLFLRLPARQRWYYAGGGAIGLLPLLVLCVVAGARPLVENLFLYPVVLVNPARRLPLSLAPAEVVFVFCLHAGAALCAIFSGIVLYRSKQRSDDAPLFLSFALLAAGLTHQGMQRADSIHVPTTAFLSVALLPLAISLLARRDRTRAPHVAWALGSAIAVVMFVVLGAPHLWKNYLHEYAVVLDTNPSKTHYFVAVRDRQFPVRMLGTSSQKVVSFLEAQSVPGERLFVGTGDLRLTYVNDTFIYHLLPWLTPASYFLEMNPLSANRPNSRLASDVASADWLVLNHIWDNSREPNLSTQPGSDAPNEVVRTMFDLRGRTGTFEVYHRKASAPAPVAVN